MLGRTEFSNVNHNNFNSLEGGLPSAWREFGLYPLINSPVEPDLKPANVPLNEINGYDLKTAGQKSAGPEKTASRERKVAASRCAGLQVASKIQRFLAHFKGQESLENIRDMKVGCGGRI